MSTAILLPASTVVLVRQASDGLEVFMVRRHDNVAFMGGAHVFPGGRVESTDADDGYEAVADGVVAATSRMPDEEPRVARGYYVAAIRETFEEAGILLARDRMGASVALPGSATASVTEMRSAVRHDPAHLIELVRSRGWRLALESLVYFAHWVTPDIETRRFDTRFFLAAAPPQQVPAHDAGETTEGLWVRPSDAIVRCRRGDLALPPPTWTTLRWLERLRNVDAALEWARRKVVPRIQPGFIQDAETRTVILPGDSAMPPVPGFDATETRFLLSAGRWTPID